jgi:hypothetical protein
MSRCLARLTLAALAAVLMAGTSARAQDAPVELPVPAGFEVLPATAYVEEEWQLHVTTADPVGDGPQLMTYMSLVQDTSEPYLWFMLNVRDAPGPYAPGGVQAQLWTHDGRLLAASDHGSAEIAADGTTITWRQRMSRPDKTSGVCRFEICNGRSPTWGDFGKHYDGAASGGVPVADHPGPAPLGATPHAQRDLSRYNPALSVYMARVSWQPNNVGRFRLVAVRQYNDEGKLLATTPLDLDVDLAK